MIVQLTQNDIDKGVSTSSLMCPISIAIRRVTGNRVSVSRTRAKVYKNTKLIASYLLPIEARKAISNIDVGFKHLVRPFEFELILEGTQSPLLEVGE